MLQMRTLQRPKSHSLQNTVTQHLPDFSSMCTVIISISGSNHMQSLLKFFWVAGNLLQPGSYNHSSCLSFIEIGKISRCRDQQSMVAVKHHSTKLGGILMHKQHSCLVAVSCTAVSFFCHFFSVTSCRGPAALLLWHKNSWYLMSF